MSLAGAGTAHPAACPGLKENGLLETCPSSRELFPAASSWTSWKDTDCMGGLQRGYGGSWLTGSWQWVVINGFYMVLQPVTSRVPQGLTLGPILLNIINDLDSEIENNHSTKLGAEVNMSEGRAI